MINPTKSFIFVFVVVLLISGAATALLFWNSSRPIQIQSAQIPTSKPQVQTPTAQTTSQVEVVNGGGEQFKKNADFGLLKSLKYNPESGEASITFDQALFLTGEDANKEYRKDYGCGKAGEPEECKTNITSPNDYYIYNPINKIYTYKIAQDAQIRLAFVKTDTDSRDGFVQATLNDLEDYIREHTGAQYSDLAIPIWISLKNNEVFELEEQYVP